MIIAGQDRASEQTQTFWLPLCGLMRATMIISHERNCSRRDDTHSFWQADYGHQTLWCVLRSLFQVGFIITWHGFSNSRTFISALLHHCGYFGRAERAPTLASDGAHTTMRVVGSALSQHTVAERESARYVVSIACVLARALPHQPLMFMQAPLFFLGH
jgi:hypothetical protein